LRFYFYFNRSVNLETCTKRRIRNEKRGPDFKSGPLSVPGKDGQRLEDQLQAELDGPRASRPEFGVGAQHVRRGALRTEACA